MVNQSRKQRGRRTEHVVAAYLAQFWEKAVAVNSGASGSDVLNTPYHIEIKARKDFSPLAWIKQNERRPDGRMAFVVYRPNGVGEDAGEYLFVARMKDVIPMLQERVPSESIVRCRGCGTWMTDGKECDVCAVIKTQN